MGLKTDLKAWYDLEEASGDRVDAHNSNDLSVSSGSPGSANGIVGDALDLNSDNKDALKGNDYTDLEFSGSFTVAGWVYLDKTDYRNILTQDDGADGWRLRIVTVEINSSFYDKFKFNVRNGDAIDVPSGENQVSTGTWYFLVFWYDDSNGEINIQLDDGSVQTKSSSGPAAFPFFRIGEDTSSSTNDNHDGRVDSVGLWDRILSSSERSDLYNGGSGVAYSDLGSDSTPPSLTSASASADGADGYTGSVDTDEDNGTLYHVVTQSSTAPSATQVKNGNNHNGNTADASGSQTISSTGTKSVGQTGVLSESTTYYVHYMHEDNAGNQSSVASSGSFTTETTYTISGTVDDGSTAIDGVDVILEDSGGNQLDTATTDSNGNYSVSADFADSELDETVDVTATDPSWIDQTKQETITTGTTSYTTNFSLNESIEIRVGIEGVTSLTGLEYAVFAESLPSNMTGPETQGNSGEITSGDFVLGVDGTNLSKGDIVFLVISDTDGDLSNRDTEKVAAGPVEVTQA